MGTTWLTCFQNGWASNSSAHNLNLFYQRLETNASISANPKNPRNINTSHFRANRIADEKSAWGAGSPTPISFRTSQVSSWSFVQRSETTSCCRFRLWFRPWVHWLAHSRLFSTTWWPKLSNILVNSHMKTSSWGRPFGDAISYVYVYVYVCVHIYIRLYNIIYIYYIDYIYILLYYIILYYIILYYIKLYYIILCRIAWHGIALPCIT